MSKRTLTMPLLALLATGLAACGSSSSKAPGVVLAPSSGATVASASPTASTPTTTTPTTSTPTATTPKPPSPLSKKPVIAPIQGAPPTHLVVKDLIKGTGAAAKSGSTITVNYVGIFYKGGKEFDSSWKRGQPLPPFQLGGGSVIRGWDQGLVGMKVGGRRELIIPPALAYGSHRTPGIPANSTLVFVVDLLASS